MQRLLLPPRPTPRSASGATRATICTSDACAALDAHGSLTDLPPSLANRYGESESPAADLFTLPSLTTSPFVPLSDIAAGTDLSISDTVNVRKSLQSSCSGLSSVADATFRPPPRCGLAKSASSDRTVPLAPHDLTLSPPAPKVDLQLCGTDLQPSDAARLEKHDDPWLWHCRLPRPRHARALQDARLQLRRARQYARGIRC